MWFNLATPCTVAFLASARYFIPLRRTKRKAETLTESTIQKQPKATFVAQVFLLMHLPRVSSKCIHYQLTKDNAYQKGEKKKW